MFEVIDLVLGSNTESGTLSSRCYGIEDRNRGPKPVRYKVTVILRNPARATDASGHSGTASQIRQVPDLEDFSLAWTLRFGSLRRWNAIREA